MRDNSPKTSSLVTGKVNRGGNIGRPIRVFCSDQMLTKKPIRKPGQDIRQLPTYTIPEAAAFLAIRERTLFSWYDGEEPILKVIIP